MDVDTAATDEFAQPEAVTRTSDICTRLLDSLRQANPQSTREALAWLQWQQLDLARAPTVNDENKQALEEQPVSIKQATEEQPVSIKYSVFYYLTIFPKQVLTIDAKYPPMEKKTTRTATSPMLQFTMMPGTSRK